jgi:hypothetical protein
VTAPDPGRLLSASQVAKLLGCDVKSVARKAQRGELRFIRTLGVKSHGHRRYPASQFVDLLNPDATPEQQTAVALIRQVRLLHRGYRHGDRQACRHCSRLAGRPIWAPCPTWQVLTGSSVPVGGVLFTPDGDAFADVGAVLGEGES